MERVLDHLNERMREFVARQRMVFLTTAAGGTFRAGAPGFVRALDAHCLAWPESRGDGLPGTVRLLFVDFFRDVTGLYICGAADLMDGTALRHLHPCVPGGPGRWALLRVAEAHLHRGRRGAPGRRRHLHAT